MTGTSRDLNHQTESCRRVRGAWKADSEYILELRTEGQSSRTAFLNKGIPLYRLSGRLRREERPLQRQGMISTRRGKWREPFIKKGGNTTALRPFHRMERLFCTETMSRAPRPKGLACAKSHSQWKRQKHKSANRRRRCKIQKPTGTAKNKTGGKKHVTECL